MVQKANVSQVMREGTNFQGANAPAPGDPSGEFLGMVSELRSSEKAMPQRTPTPLTYIRPGEFRFRTRPGYRNTAIKLRIQEFKDDDIENQKARDRWKKNAKRNGWELKELEQWDLKVYEITGEPYIQFRPVRGEQEATFTTKDEIVAAYIRRRIAAGEFRGVIYEDVRPVEIEINGEKQLFVPANDAAREAVAFAQAAGD